MSVYWTSTSKCCQESIFVFDSTTKNVILPSFQTKSLFSIIEIVIEKRKVGNDLAHKISTPVAINVLQTYLCTGFFQFASRTFKARHKNEKCTRDLVQILTEGLGTFMGFFKKGKAYICVQ